jgi:hypothetical protein
MPKPVFAPTRNLEDPFERRIPTVRYEFRLAETFSGAFDSNTATVAAEVPTDGGCGVAFELGKDYLVFGSHDKGEISVSQCSRIELLENAANELVLLRETKRGSVRPRLWGSVYDERLLLNGWHSTDWSRLTGVAGVRLTARGRTRTFVSRSDEKGRFTFIGLPPGEYHVVPELARGRTVVGSSGDEKVRIGRCSGEISFFTRVTSLSGTLRSRDGTPLPEGIQVWVVPASISPPSSDRGTFTSTNADGTWEFQGLLPDKYRLGVNVFPTRDQTPLVAGEWYSGTDRASDAMVLEVSDERPIQLSIQVSRVR